MQIKVTQNEVKINKDILNDGEYNIHKCQFDFDEEYNGLVQKAVFTLNDGTPYLETIVNNECNIPIEVLEEGVLKIGVYAYETEGDELVLRYSPSPDIIHVFDGSYVKDAQNSEGGTPTEYEQLESRVNNELNEMNALADDLEEKVESGYFKGDKGDTGADAKINGVNTLTIEAGTNITLDQEGSTLTINSTGGGTSNYADLTNKPKINSIELNGNKTLNDLGIQPAGNYALSSEIPTKTSELTNDSGFITSYTETDPTVPSYVKGITQQNITDWNDKQDELVSGTNIKTINNESILGSGNIEIQGGGASYTAGTNIEITSENVINNKIPYNKNFSGQGIYLGSNQVAYNRPTSTFNVVIGNNLQAGYNSGTIRNVIIGDQGGISTSERAVENSVVIGMGAYVNYSNSIVIGRNARATESNQAILGGSNSPINKIEIYTSNGVKEMATQEYVDNQIGNINTALDTINGEVVE